jgi:hypothetical protein
MLTIPVLVHGASMPSASDLPESLQELAFRNAAIVRDDPDFRRDMGRLVEQIRKFEEQEPTTTRLKAVQPAPPAVIPDPFEDLVPMQPAAQSAYTPSGAQQSSASAPKSMSQNKWLWIIGGGILLLIGCYVCQYASNLGYYGF